MIPVSLYIIDCCLLSRITNEMYFSKSNSSYCCKAFDNIKDCIQAINNYGLKVIISDTDFNDLEEINKIKLLKSRYPDAKIIFYSANEDTGNVLTFLSCGASAYVFKRERKKLANTINKVLKDEFSINLRIAKQLFSSLSNSNFNHTEVMQENQKIKDCLTEREIEVLKLLTDGKTNTQIADAIVISANTAKAHVGSIFTKLSVKDRVQAAVKAVRANIL